MLAILLGSKSRNLDDPVFPSKKLPAEFVSLLKGTPSTTKSAWLLPLNELRPRITTFVADPDIPPADVILTPDALPIKTRATSPSALDSKSSAPTDETA